MKKIATLICGFAIFAGASFAQVLPGTGVENTVWTGFGKQPGKDVSYYGFYDTLQARVDIAQFTMEGMLNWAAENSDGNFSFKNTEKTPFWYTNNSSQGGVNTQGVTETYYVNFIWNAFTKNKHNLDFGMGTRLAWKIGPAPVYGGYFWEPYTHVVQGGLKEGVPGGADVVGYIHYDNLYAKRALAARYIYSNMIEAGISIPDGVTVNKPFFNAAFAIKPIDNLRVSVAFEDVGKKSADLYAGFEMNFKKPAMDLDAYLEIENLGSDAGKNKTWGFGAAIEFYPLKKQLFVRPEAGVTFYRESKYTPAFYAAGRAKYDINAKFAFGGFASMAFGSKNTDWENVQATKDWTGGFILDIRPDFTFTLDKRNSFTAALDFQNRIAYNKVADQIWSLGFYWTYKR